MLQYFEFPYDCFHRFDNTQCISLRTNISKTLAYLKTNIIPLNSENILCALSSKYEFKEVF